MSRIGRMPVKLPQGVTVTVNGSEVKVSGVKGNLTMILRPELKLVTTAEEATFEIVIKGRSSSAFMGTARANFNNMVLGVSQGFEKKLELVGVGFRAKAGGADSITLTLGFSHPVEFKFPAGISADVVDAQNVTIKGIDKHMVGQVSANIRKLRKPEPYKGKGIKYSTERVRRKQGKSGKV